MTETTNKVPDQSATTTDAGIAQDQDQAEAASDVRQLVTPLVKYGVIAVVIVSAIVTATIMLNSNLGTVEDEIASIQNEITSQNQAELEVDTPAAEEAISEVTLPTEVAVELTTTDLVSPALTPVAITPEAETAITETETAATETAAPVTVNSENVAPVFSTNAAPRVFVPPVPDHKARIAEQHAYIAKQDQEYLDTLKVRQAERLQSLQQQLARQQKRIDDIEKRNQEIYELRAASIKRMQQAREESLNRI